MVCAKWSGYQTIRFCKHLFFHEYNFFRYIKLGIASANPVINDRKIKNKLFSTTIYVAWKYRFGVHGVYENQCTRNIRRWYISLIILLLVNAIFQKTRLWYLYGKVYFIMVISWQCILVKIVKLWCWMMQMYFFCTIVISTNTCLTKITVCTISFSCDL